MYTNETYDLTIGEQLFVQAMLQENGSSSDTPAELLEDLMSCVRVKDMQEYFPGRRRLHRISATRYAV